MPRQMTVALDHEWASLTPFGADDQKTAFTPDRIAIEKLDGRVVSERLEPSGIVRRARVRHPVGSVAPRVLQRLRAVDLPHHAVPADARRRLGAGNRRRRRRRADLGGPAGRVPARESQRIRSFRSSTSETIICCAAMTTASTWQAAFPPSSTSPASSKPTGIKFPSIRRAYRADADGNAMHDQLMVAIDLSDIRLG